MKNKKNILFLVENGLSSKVISKLTDNQVRVLVEKFKKEAKEEIKQTVTNVTYDPNNPNDQKLLAQKGLHIDPSSKKITMTQGSGGEIKEDETNVSGNTSNVNSTNAQGDVELQKYTGQDAPHMADDMAPDGMDDDSDNNRSNMGMAESEITEKFESKAQQGLFWARCNKCSSKDCKWCKMAKEFSDSTSKKDYKKMPEKIHPEKTVKYKKKETNENLQKFLEKKISEMVDNKIEAKMSKKDLIETIKKKSKSMIIRRPKKVTMFSDEAPMELPIAKMFSIGKK
jgi:hypothetical protein